MLYFKGFCLIYGRGGEPVQNEIDERGLVLVLSGLHIHWIEKCWIEAKINFVASEKLATLSTTMELINFTISPIKRFTMTSATEVTSAYLTHAERIHNREL